ncbi:hypothetical protein [Methylobacterium nonmethylotrophicum]|uniref:Uncharacterized protein n=1 Tax=Methylobacterium nonmethylotrophicum TaxID=1141884 RepID=A0A4Z0NJN9_9HYPH|nr:hypothetical protein [Methylobacterium nonmethylotrophicum]TGD95704.1 hypothetical protein EU555_26855 [Methylobacterium nonmethylotrophicum]
MIARGMTWGELRQRTRAHRIARDADPAATGTPIGHTSGIGELRVMREGRGSADRSWKARRAGMPGDARHLSGPMTVTLTGGLSPGEEAPGKLRRQVG